MVTHPPADRLPLPVAIIGSIPARLMLLPLAFALSGCAVHRVAEDGSAPAVDLHPAYTEHQAPSGPTGDWEARSWWESFEDPVLRELINQGLAGSFDLQVFAARIEQAGALARQAGSRLLPSLDATARYESEWGGDDTGRGDEGSNEDRRESTRAGALLSWEVDLFGRLSSARKARVFQQRATYQDWLDAQLILSSAVAEQYFEIKEQRRQRAVLQEQIAISESLLGLTRLRFGQGQSSIVDVLQQREQLAETKARVPGVEARIGLLQYTLDALLGKVPGTGPTIVDDDLSILPLLPEVGVPANLLHRRPDLRAARERVVALDYRIGEAIADRLPTLRIGGGLDWRGDPSFGDLITSAFAGLAAPVLDGGERRAEVDLRRAELDEALARYADQFLSAWTEVESVLLLERKMQERLGLVEAQLQTARRLLFESRNRFSQGLTDYLPVLTALNIVQNLEREIVTSQRALLSARIGLHRALGGPIVYATIPEPLARP